MALTQSTMLDLGSAAPTFSLPDTNGNMVDLQDFASAKALVVLFICNHCPYVIHIAPALANLAQEYQNKGVQFVAINSNDTTAYPADDLGHMRNEVEQRGYTFPYLLDATQDVAKRYQAACTPDIYVFNESQKLVYRGEFDTTRPHRISSGNYDARNGEATGASLATALDALINEQVIPEPQIPSMGCNIKWQPGNEPDYF